MGVGVKTQVTNAETSYAQKPNSSREDFPRLGWKACEAGLQPSPGPPLQLLPHSRSHSRSFHQVLIVSPSAPITEKLLEDGDKSWGPGSTAATASDKEDDALRHHDLVIILHPAQ